MIEKHSKFWSIYEIDILKINYINGIDIVFDLLSGNRTKNAIQGKAKKLGLLVDKSSIFYDYDEIYNAVMSSYSYAEVFRKIKRAGSGEGRRCLKRYILKNNIDISHFNPYKHLVYRNPKYNIYDILKDDVIYNSNNLKKRLYKEGLKERKCELCGQGEDWKGNHMALILDHINGKHNDNRIENLRIVCPNCNATLPTHCIGHKKRDKQTKKVKICECGKEIYNDSKTCKNCNELSQRKVERPPLEQLLKEVEELGYCGTGRKYGVSDNAIRKWIKNYNK